MDGVAANNPELIELTKLANFVNLGPSTTSWMGFANPKLSELAKLANLINLRSSTTSWMR